MTDQSIAAYIIPVLHSLQQPIHNGDRSRNRHDSHGSLSGGLVRYVIPPNQYRNSTLEYLKIEGSNTKTNPVTVNEIAQVGGSSQNVNEINTDTNVIAATIA